jgi:hypothetical protein
VPNTGQERGFFLQVLGSPKIALECLGPLDSFARPGCSRRKDALFDLKSILSNRFS